jgi:plasmid stabilization system protein ParE
MRIEWSTHAVSDLQSISEYIEKERSLETANRITRVIYEAVQTLRKMVLEARVLILNIMHGAQKWP